MIPKEAIHRLNTTPIEGVAERLGLTVKHHRCLCPFHADRHPSLSLRGSRYKCFVCGASGGPIDLAMEVNHQGFADACQWLANDNNVALEEAKPAEKEPATKFDPTRYMPHVLNPWLGDEARQFLFAERRIAPWVAQYCRLSQWRDRDGFVWLQIPYFDRDWTLVGIQWRNLTPHHRDSQGEGRPRFRFPRGAQTSLYNTQVLAQLHEGEPLYITEGASDTFAVMSSGRKAMAIPSATLLKPAELSRLKALGFDRLNLHICPDQDEPGEKLFLELRHHFPQIVRHQLPEGFKDFGEWWKRECECRV